jgi:cytochrome c2
MNLTHDPVYGIGNWTDGELYAFLRTGVRPDGTFAPTYMPKYPLMAEYDIESLIAWLRSDRPEVQATQEEAPPSKPSFFTKFLTNVAIKPLPMPAAPIQVPDTQETVAFGRYVADGVYACWACHSADFARQNSLQPSLSFHFYGGGNPMLNLSGEVVPSSNLTPDAQGLPGGYDAAGFLDALKYGKKKNGELTRYPMIPHTVLSDTEVHAVYAYLKTVPPLPDMTPAGK